MAVLLYTLRDCPHCGRMRAELARRGVTYTEVSLDARKASVTELVKLTGGRRIVPVLVEGGRVHVAPEGGTEF